MAVTVNILCEHALYEKNNFQDTQSFYQDKQVYLSASVRVPTEKEIKIPLKTAKSACVTGYGSKYILTIITTKTLFEMHVSMHTHVP